MKITIVEWIGSVCLSGLIMCTARAETAAANGYQWEYTVSGGAAEIGLTSSAKASASGSLTIPDTIAGYPVSALKAEACAGCTGLTSLTLSKGLVKIGSGAFRNCTGLTTLVKPANVGEIASDAFAGCGNVVDVTMSGIGGQPSGFSGWSVYITGSDYVRYYKSSVYRGESCSMSGSVTGPMVLPFEWYQSSGSSTYDSYRFYVDGERVLSESAHTSPYQRQCVSIGAGTHSLKWEFYRSSSGPSGYSTGYITVYRLADPSEMRTLKALLPDSYAKVTSVTFADGTEEIPASVCAGCVSLASVKIPTGVTKVGDGAFSGCAALPKLTIPSSVTEIGANAFDGCSRLGTLAIEPGTTSIGAGAFKGCTTLTTISIPEGVKTVGADAFAGCVRATSLSLPSTLAEIGGGAFSNCTGLTTLTLPKAVAKIGSGAFRGCTGLTTLVKPANVGEVASDAFAGCGNVVDVTMSGIGSQLTDFSGWRVYGTYDDCVTHYDYSINRGRSSTMSGSVTGPLVLPFAWHQSDGSSWDAFYFYVDGEQVVREDAPSSEQVHYVSVGAGAHSVQWTYSRSSSSSYGSYYADGYVSVYRLADPSEMRTLKALLPDSYAKVTSVTFADGTEEIPASVCAGCASLASMKIPTGVTKIGDGAFSGCTAIANVTVPSGVAKIGDGTFSGCTALTSLTIPASVVEIGANAFDGCSRLGTLAIKPGTTSIGAGAFKGCTTLTAISIPEGVKTIGADAFAGCVRATSLSLPSTLAEIGDGAFSGCTGLTTLTLPKAVAKIGSGAFRNCTGLRTLVKPANVGEIAADAFAGCGNIVNVTMSGIGSQPSGFTGWTVYGNYADCVSYRKYNVYRGETWSMSGLVTGPLVLPFSWRQSGGSSLYDTFTCSVDGTSVVNVSAPSSDVAHYVSIGAGSHSIGWTYSRYSSSSYGNYYADGYVSVYRLADPSGMRTLKALLPDSYAKVTSVTFAGGTEEIPASVCAGCASLASVKIPSSVTVIGANAFDGCSRLAMALSLPSGITSIGSRAFAGCTAITSLSLPSTLTSIGSEAFTGCAKIPKLNVPASVTSIGANAFKDCAALTSVTVPVGGVSFAGCTAVTSVTLGGSGTSIVSAFPDCYRKIKTVKFLDGVTSVPTGSCAGCPALSSVALPNSVTEIGANAFSGCMAVASLTLPKNLKTIGATALANCTALTTLTIPEGVTSIGANAFKGCTRLASVTLPTTLTSIGDAAFSGCNALAKIAIPSSVQSFGKDVFAGCGSITSVEIGTPAVLDSDIKTLFPASYQKITKVVFGRGVTELPQSVCEGCVALADVTIPEGVAKIGSLAFYGCTALKSVNLPSTLVELGGIAFYNCSSLASFVIPLQTVRIGNAPFEGSAWYKALPNGMVIKDGCLLGYKGTCPASLAVPSGVRVIADSAFINQTSMTSVILPNTLADLGNGVFKGCSGLATVSFPASSLRRIGKGTFESCSALRSVDIPSSVASVDYQAFHACTHLSSVAFHDGLFRLENKAFEGCSALTSVTFPRTLKTINSAFVNCTGLQTVKFLSAKTSCPTGAFAGCSNIRTMTAPSTIARLSDVMPGAYKTVTSVTLTDGVTALTSTLLNGCEGLTTLTLPPSVTAVNADACTTCKNLAVVNFSEGLLSVGARAFQNCTKLAAIELPYSVNNVQANAFTGCTGLTHVFAPNVNLVAPGAGAFAGCDHIEDATIPMSWRPAVTFPAAVRTTLKYVWLADGTTIVPGPGLAFGNSEALTELTLPDSVMRMAIAATDLDGALIFSGCYALKSVYYLGDYAPTVGADLYFDSYPGLTSLVGTSSKGWKAVNTTDLPSDRLWPVRRSGDKDSQTDYGREIGHYDECKITYDPCNGEPTVTKRCVKGRKVGQLLRPPTKEGCVFGGWYTSATAGSRWSNTSVISSDQKLFAHWTAVQYEIEYDFGEDGEWVSNPTTYTYGKAVTLAKPTREWYAFTGWTLNGELVTQIPADSKGDVKLVATWRPNFGSIAFAKGGGSGADVSPMKCLANKVYNLPPCTFTPPVGKRFVGWACSNGRRYDGAPSKAWLNW